MKHYSYKDDLDNFYDELSRPAEGLGEPLTMYNYGSEMKVHPPNKGYTEIRLLYDYIDMENTQRKRDEFDSDQRQILDEADEKRRRYTFLCYPDIPARIMRILYNYAERNNSLRNRLPLWKIGRCAIKDEKAAQILCRLLDYDVVAPDYVIINQQCIEKWKKLHDDICLASGLPSDADIVTSQLTEQGAALLKQEAEAISAVKR